MNRVISSKRINGNASNVASSKIQSGIREIFQTLNSETSSKVETEQNTRLIQLHKQIKELESQNSKLIDLALTVYLHMMSLRKRSSD